MSTKEVNGAELISVIVPLYNESAGLASFHGALIASLKDAGVQAFELLYCDDGSSDDTPNIVKRLHANDPRIKLIALSRNFGKENALTAGIAQAAGQAIVMLDGDGQHPVALLTEFIKAWRNGQRVVIGLRTSGSGGTWLKRVCSTVFYKTFNRLSTQKILPGSSDYRLIDQQVREVFLALQESDRITKVLIDWLGFDPHYIPFKTQKRLDGKPGYNNQKLAKLAMNSVVSFSPAPMYLFGYLGLLITALSFLLGVAVIIEQLLLNDPLGWRFTGTAMLGILLLFLVGVVLLSLGLISIYISHIHTLSKRRPLYIIDHKKSVGLN